MLYNEIQQFIKENKEYANFTGGVEKDKIKEVEEILQVKLPDSYKWFLEEYGYGDMFGEEIIGCGKSEVPSVIQQTIRFRELGLPQQYVVIQNCDEWIYCLDTNEIIDNECPVVSWDRINGLEGRQADNFVCFLLSVFKEAKEDWEDEF